MQEIGHKFEIYSDAEKINLLIEFNSPTITGTIYLRKFLNIDLVETNNLFRFTAPEILKAFDKMCRTRKAYEKIKVKYIDFLFEIIDIMYKEKLKHVFLINT